MGSVTYYTGGIMSTYEERRMKKAFCPICKQKILSSNEVQFIKTQYGRKTFYTFFHNDCLNRLHLNREGLLDA